jgi:hypothetical protein
MMIVPSTASVDDIIAQHRAPSHVCTSLWNPE